MQMTSLWGTVEFFFFERFQIYLLNCQMFRQQKHSCTESHRRLKNQQMMCLVLAYKPLFPAPIESELVQ